MSVHPEGESCSDLGRVHVLNDPVGRDPLHVGLHRRQGGGDGLRRVIGQGNARLRTFPGGVIWRSPIVESFTTLTDRVCPLEMAEVVG